jgi:excinuclease ABC subunit C
LQHQINRCTAPCVGLISPEDYLQDIDRACRFLRCQSPELIQELIGQMEAASKQLNFEKAAEYRDQIQHLRHVQEQQSVEQGTADIDVLGMASQSGVVVIVLLLFRGGRLLGSKSYFPEHCLNLEDQDVIEGFIGQYYLQDAGRGTLPKEIIYPIKLENEALLQDALSEHIGMKIRLASQVRGDRQKWLALAATNAENALKTALSSKENMKTRLVSFQDAFGLPQLPTRLECYDISHSSGEKTVASCVVFNESGPAKSDYRIFNIEGITAGDDYAAMEQVLMRRLKRLKAGEGKKTGCDVN